MSIDNESPQSNPVSDCWDKLPEEVKQAINMAKDELDRGEGIPHADVRAEIDARFFGC